MIDVDKLRKMGVFKTIVRAGDIAEEYTDTTIGDVLEAQITNVEKAVDGGDLELVEKNLNTLSKICDEVEGIENGY